MMENPLARMIREAWNPSTVERSPCGHDSDVLRLMSTVGPLLYCQRCERGFDSVCLVPA